jgi:hypothetical protein
LAAFPLFKEPPRLQEMFLNQYPALLLMEQVHLCPPTLPRSRRPFPFITNQYSSPCINRPHPIISLCIIHSLPNHLIISLCIIHSLPNHPMSWSINIIVIIIQDLCVHIDHIHPGYITPQL